jgi:hypothetical protein
MRKGADHGEQDLPDYSPNWELPEASASNAEIEARFYYEFARESQTILSLTERLCHFTRGEMLRAGQRTLNYPAHPLVDLHPCCINIAYALMPTINLREVSWNRLEHEQKQSLIREFSRQEAAFRRLNYFELIEFADLATRAYCWSQPTEPNYTRLLGDPEAKPPDAIGPWWYCSSRLSWHGIEQIAIRIDWSQGPQSVKAAMEQWFQRHKRGLLRLKSEGKLPGGKRGSHRFHVPEDTGAKTPRRKYIAALRGLGAMRLLRSRTLREAIESTKGALYSTDPRSRSAWNVGVRAARQTFQDLFYPQDKNSLRVRRHLGLPEVEEPISYQQYSLRNYRKK